MDSVCQLVTTAAELISVSGQPGPPGYYEQLEFVFTFGILRLTCDDETDEIVVLALQSAADAGGVPVAELEALPGMLLEHAWTMTNHQGYQDGIQLRFLTPSTRRFEVRQFEVGGSLIAISRVQRYGE